MLRALFPSLRVEGSTHSPGALKEGAAAALTAAGYASLAYMALGSQLLAPLGLAEPAWLAQQREARWPPMVAFFVRCVALRLPAAAARAPGHAHEQHAPELQPAHAAALQQRLCRALPG